MALSLTQLHNKIVTSQYTRNEIKGLFYSSVDTGCQERVDLISKLCTVRFDVKLEWRDKVLEDNVTISEHTPRTERVLVLDPETEDNMDVIIAKKLIQLKESATKRGLEFNLQFKDVKQLLSRKVCHYSGVRFNNKDNELRLTIDRVDNRMGYIKGNVVACTYKYNQIKELLLESNSSKVRTSVKELKRFLSKLEV